MHVTGHSSKLFLNGKEIKGFGQSAFGFEIPMISPSEIEDSKNRKKKKKPQFYYLLEEVEFEHKEDGTITGAGNAEAHFGIMPSGTCLSFNRELKLADDLEILSRMKDVDEIMEAIKHINCKLLKQKEKLIYGGDLGSTE